ncbi:hypothetical protein BDR04DRAFT_165781 [Suillus decipiens]|nr:hypothetical protein BDR04DRAFT_165781 [Suillus decipiens]
MNYDLLSTMLLALIAVSPLGARADSENDLCVWSACGGTCVTPIKQYRPCLAPGGWLFDQFCCECCGNDESSGLEELPDITGNTQSHH